MTRHRIGYAERHDAIRERGPVIYDPAQLWPSADTPRPPRGEAVPKRTHHTLHRRRSWAQRATDLRWAVEDSLSALAGLCHRRARTLDRVVFGIAILTVTLIVVRAGAHLIGKIG